jgi:hypothetical protein
MHSGRIIDAIVADAQYFAIPNDFVISHENELTEKETKTK